VYQAEETSGFRKEYIVRFRFAYKRIQGAQRSLHCNCAVGGELSYLNIERKIYTSTYTGVCIRNHYGPPKPKNVLPCLEDINYRCIFLGFLESVLTYVQYALVQFVLSGWHYYLD
jgi:hypothetical protein